MGFQDILVQLGKVAPAMVQGGIEGGRYGAPVAQQMWAHRQRQQQQQKDRQRQDQMSKELAQIAPNGPSADNLQDITQVFMKYGKPEMAMRALEMVEQNSHRQWQREQGEAGMGLQRESLDVRRDAAQKPYTRDPEDELWGWDAEGKPAKLSPAQLGATSTAGLKDVLQLRKHYSAEMGGKNYSEAATAWKQVDRMYKEWDNPPPGTARNRQAGQVLMVMIQKIMDPQSVVRGSEYERSADFISFAERAEYLYERAASGNVTEDLMRDVYAAAKTMMAAASEMQSERYNETSGFLSGEGVEPQRVLRGFINPNEMLSEVSAVEVPEGIPPGSRPDPSKPGVWIDPDGSPWGTD